LEGTQQSGTFNFKLADITRDGKVLQAARLDAEEILDADPHLEKPVNLPLHRYLSETFKDQTQWSKIS
jgi:ATP-dependent DNA helicase RecG